MAGCLPLIGQEIWHYLHQRVVSVDDVALRLPLRKGKKVYINGPGHMTKMAVMPLYGKNLQKSSPTELIVL